MDNHNTLIVFASKHGNTEKCARELFHLLDGKVDFCNLTERTTYPDISTYSTIIAGGPIYNGKIEETISSFCYQNEEDLKNKRLGLFICCLYSGDRAERELSESFPETLLQAAIVTDYFGGEMPKSNLTFLEKIVLNQMIDSNEQFLNNSLEKIHRFAQKMNANDVSEE